MIEKSRMSNLVISIDKVKHCLQQMGTSAPPLRTVPYSQIFQKYWNEEGALKPVLHSILDKIENSPEKVRTLDLFWKMVEIAPKTEEEEENKSCFL